MAAPAAEDLDMSAPALFEQVVHIFEELHMAALVAGDGDALGVLLYGGVDDLDGRFLALVLAHVPRRGLEQLISPTGFRSHDAAVDEEVDARLAGMSAAARCATSR